MIENYEKTSIWATQSWSKGVLRGGGRGPPISSECPLDQDFNGSDRSFYSFHGDDGFHVICSHIWCIELLLWSSFLSLAPPVWIRLSWILSYHMQQRIALSTPKKKKRRRKNSAKVEVGRRQWHNKRQANPQMAIGCNIATKIKNKDMLNNCWF